MHKEYFGLQAAKCANQQNRC